MKRIVFLGFPFFLSLLSAFAVTPDDPVYIVVLVRLKTSQNKIDALNKMGKKNEALALAARQKSENDDIVDVFIKNFSFYKVRFFYSDCSASILEGKYNRCLMNSTLQLDSSLVLTKNNFLVAEFDRSETSNIEGLILKDSDFKQKNAPFPYLIKKYKFLVYPRQRAEMVEMLNERLWKSGKK